MPYIKKERRGGYPEGAGELCYHIYRQCKTYIELYRPSFKTLSDVITALECAKLEFYRREMAPYEDKKIEENGDV